MRKETDFVEDWNFEKPFFFWSLSLSLNFINLDKMHFQHPFLVGNKAVIISHDKILRLFVVCFFFVRNCTLYFVIENVYIVFCH